MRPFSRSRTTVTDLDSLLWRDEAGGQERLYYVNGVPHLGVGHNLAARGISPRAVRVIYEDDKADVLAELDARLSSWRTFSAPRQAVLVSMAYQMGVDGLLGFHEMLTWLSLGEFAKAAGAMRNSEWAQIQTPARAERLATMMETDTWV